MSGWNPTDRRHAVGTARQRSRFLFGFCGSCWQPRASRGLIGGTRLEPRASDRVVCLAFVVHVGNLAPAGHRATNRQHCVIIFSF